MKRALFSLGALAGCIAFIGSGAHAQTKLDGKPTAAEARFVERISADLRSRFPTTESAIKAGYVRCTDEHATGAIRYANRPWTSDEKHPSQLWYDVKGRLLGADFSVLQADSPEPPKMFGVDPSLWITLRAHVHYGVDLGSGTVKYAGMGAKTIEQAGASLEKPTPEAIVAAGAAKDVKDVRFVFTLPLIWDLQIWVLPNSNGAFAEKNPDVIPAHPVKENAGH